MNRVLINFGGFILGCLIVFGMISLSNYLASGFNKTDLEKTNPKASVQIIGTKSMGSGIIVSSANRVSYILTNNHVCAINKVTTGKYDLLEINMYNLNKKVYGIVAKIDSVKDLCLIKVNVGELPTALISDDFKIHDKVYNISSPLGYNNYKADGYIGGQILFDRNDYKQFSISIYGGSSGSGVFDYNSHKLVGLVAMGYGTAATISGMVPLEDIRLFLSGVIK